MKVWEFDLVPKVQVVFHNTCLWLLPLPTGLIPLFYCIHIELYFLFQFLSFVWFRGGVLIQLQRGYFLFLCFDSFVKDYYKLELAADAWQENKYITSSKIHFLQILSVHFHHCFLKLLPIEIINFSDSRVTWIPIVPIHRKKNKNFSLNNSTNFFISSPTLLFFF